MRNDLLAEDFASVREVAGQYLEGRAIPFWRLHLAGKHSERAKDFQGAIHLLLTDVLMPGMSWPELAVHMAALRPDIKTILTSGYADDTILRQEEPDAGVVSI